MDLSRLNKVAEGLKEGDTLNVKLKDGVLDYEIEESREEIPGKTPPDKRQMFKALFESESPMGELEKLIEALTQDHSKCVFEKLTEEQQRRATMLIQSEFGDSLMDTAGMVNKFANAKEPYVECINAILHDTAVLHKLDYVLTLSKRV